MTIAVDLVSTVISLQEGLLSVTSKSMCMKYHPAMTKAVDLGLKEIKQVNKTHRCLFASLIMFELT